MRGIRLAAFALVAVLASVVLSHMFTIDRAITGPAPNPAPRVEHRPSLGTGMQPNVPPPPPAGGAGSRQPAKAHATPVGVAQSVPANAGGDPAAPDPGGPKPVIWRGNDPAAQNDNGSGGVVAQTAPVDQPKGPVIVVPHERPKEDSRGVRWLKSVGHALGIGGPKDPVDQAFK